jgi:2-haloacid dehalogenase
VLHRIGLDVVLRERGLALPAPAREELTQAWHRLDPWPDVVPGLTRLKATHVIAPCSNGHIALSVDLARHAGLPWDAILGAELARAYKPDPRVYLTSVRALGLAPHEACMVAAHRDDLIAAAAAGLRTAFVPRPGEPEGPPFEPDVLAWDFLELAESAWPGLR